MSERDLYGVFKKYLENHGYYPVKIEPQVKIRGYRPDLTALKGKEVQCIEVKPNFDENALMASVSQARVYQLASTSV